MSSHVLDSGDEFQINAYKFKIRKLQKDVELDEIAREANKKDDKFEIENR